ncbi:MAG: hypothetical protein QOF51_485 [Chloroflexota bacterium]|nr:hypothetical protein [Chloroflexota bacterium]
MTNTIHLLIGCEEGGLTQLTSADGGRNWGTPEVINPELDATAFATTTDGTVYVGTRGNGLLRSRDGLRSWEAVPLPEGTEKIRSLYQDDGRLLIGTEPAGVFEYLPDGKSGKLGDLWSAPGASNWFYPVPVEAVHIRGLSVDPNQRDRIYTAIQVGGVGISPDDGDTWYDKRNLDLDVHVVLPHPKRAGVVFAGSGGGGVYRSTDSGENWEFISEGCGQFVLDFAMDPRDADRMILGTASGEFRSWSGAAGARGQLFRTEDGGASWRKLTGGLPETLLSRVTAVVIDRADPDQVYFGAGLPSRANVPLHAVDAGVYHSADGGDSWEKIFTVEHGEPPAIWCVHD